MQNKFKKSIQSQEDLSIWGLKIAKLIHLTPKIVIVQEENALQIFHSKLIDINNPMTFCIYSLKTLTHTYSRKIRRNFALIQT